MKKSVFIVIEGTDGAGKGTQVGLLKEKLKQLKIAFKVIDFPRYEDNAYGKLVGKYLKGEIQKFGGINPYLLTLAYAGDRALAREQMNEWIKDGNLVIANRYLHSNVAYSIARLPEDIRDEFIRWNYDLEYNTNGIPKEELVILLYIDPEVAQKNIEQKGERGYMGGKGKDIHEKDLQYQKDVANAYLYLSKRYLHWKVINCASNGKMRTPEDIHQEIIELVQRYAAIPEARPAAKQVAG